MNQGDVLLIFFHASPAALKFFEIYLFHAIPPAPVKLSNAAQQIIVLLHRNVCTFSCVFVFVFGCNSSISHQFTSLQFTYVFISVNDF